MNDLEFPRQQLLRLTSRTPRQITISPAHSATRAVSIPVRIHPTRSGLLALGSTPLTVRLEEDTANGARRAGGCQRATSLSAGGRLGEDLRGVVVRGHASRSGRVGKSRWRYLRSKRRSKLSVAECRPKACGPCGICFRCARYRKPRPKPRAPAWSRATRAQ